MNNIQFKSIIVRPVESFQTQAWEVTATVLIDGATWKNYNKNGNLGMLYGVDIGNRIYKMYNEINTFCPTVSHSIRCKNGLKTVILYYRIADPNAARALGCKVTRNGEPSYGDYVNLPVPATVPQKRLKIV